MPIGTPTDLGHFAGTSTPTSGSITTTNAVSTGDLIVVIRYANVTPSAFTSLTDSSSNSYVQVASGLRATGVTPLFDCWYCAGATSMASSSTISFNFSGSALREGVTAFKVSGMATSGTIADPNSVITANGTTGTAASATSLNVRTLYTQALLVACVVSGSNYSAFTPGGSWTAVGGASNVGANITPAYQTLSAVNGAGVAWAPTWTTSVLYRSFGLAFVGGSGKFGVGGGATLLGVGS